MNFSKLNRGLMAAILLAFTLSACNNDDDNGSDVTPPPAGEGNVEIKFDHVWGPMQTPFALEQQFLHPATGDSLTFTKLAYYISNIQLHNVNGDVWAEPESYHIVDFDNAHHGTEVKMEIEGVPAGDYNRITYTIGVDSTRNVSGAQEGALDPANGMFWSWTTGYIFVKAEGQTPHTTMGTFTYHLGGFSGANNAIRENSHGFDGALLGVAPNAKPSIHLVINAARFWHGGIQVATMPMVHMPGPNAVTLANNFAGGFRFDHLHN